MATQYFYEFPGSVRLTPRDGRALVAAMLDGIPGVESIFHYREDGMPVPGADADTLERLREAGKFGKTVTEVNNLAAFPRTRIFARNSCVRILALTEEAADVVDSHAVSIGRLLAARLGQVPRMVLAPLELAITPSSRTWSYQIYEMVLDTGPERIQALKEMERSKLRELIANKVLTGIGRQAQALSLEVPDLDEAIRSTLDYREIAGTSMVHRRNPKTGEWRLLAPGAMVFGLGFKAPFKFSDGWCVGKMTARGYGRIWYSQAPSGSES